MGVPIHSTEFTGQTEPWRATDSWPLEALSPLTVAAIAVLVVMAALIGWMLGRDGSRGDASDAPAIWKAVNEAIQAAMKAHSDAVEGKARDLRAVIDKRLGRTLALAGGLKPLKALDEALKDDPDHGEDHGHGGHGQGHDDQGGHDDHAHDASATGVRIDHADRVVIHTARGPKDDHRPHHPPKPPTRAERRNAIRRAVSDLNDHWRDKEARLREIDAAHRELSTSQGGAKGGWRFS